MPLLQKASEIYQREGLVVLLQDTVNYIQKQISPEAPTVSAGVKIPHIWYLKHVYNFLFNIVHGQGVDVMEKDWDTLILLDACRYDSFNKLNNINGELGWVISQGVDSKEFIKRNFLNRELLDTVYVTANPHVKYIDNDVFYDVVSEPLKKWDSEVQCVPPKKVTAAAIEAHQKYPNKRIIIHYMQPHDPPLGPTADQLRKDYGLAGPSSDNQEKNNERIMSLVSADEISEEVAYKAYEETLQIVLEEVNVLLEEITGKVVISSDHGEMFGEKPYLLLPKLYEHFRNPRTIELCKVPWLIVETTDTRRKITSENKINGEKADLDYTNIEKQLEALGYKD